MVNCCVMFTCALQPSDVLGRCHGKTLQAGQKSFLLHSSNSLEQMNEQSDKIQPGANIWCIFNAWCKITFIIFKGNEKLT